MNGLILFFTICTFFSVRLLGWIFKYNKKTIIYGKISLDTDPTIVYFMITMLVYPAASVLITGNDYIIWLSITLCYAALTPQPTMMGRIYCISIATEALLFSYFEFSNNEYIVIIFLLGMVGFFVINSFNFILSKYRTS